MRAMIRQGLLADRRAPTCRSLVQAVPMLNGPHPALHRSPNGFGCVRMRTHVSAGCLRLLHCCPKLFKRKLRVGQPAMQRNTIVVNCKASQAAASTTPFQQSPVQSA